MSCRLTTLTGAGKKSPFAQKFAILGAGKGLLEEWLEQQSTCMDEQPHFAIPGSEASCLAREALNIFACAAILGSGL